LKARGLVQPMPERAPRPACDRRAAHSLTGASPANVREGRTVPPNHQDVLAGSSRRPIRSRTATLARRMGRSLQPSPSPRHPSMHPARPVARQRTRNVRARPRLATGPTGPGTQDHRGRQDHGRTLEHPTRQRLGPPTCPRLRRRTRRRDLRPRRRVDPIVADQPRTPLSTTHEHMIVNDVSRHLSTMFRDMTVR
jgi:hypothetical protein